MTNRILVFRAKALGRKVSINSFVLYLCKRGRLNPISIDSLTKMLSNKIAYATLPCNCSATTASPEIQSIKIALIFTIMIQFHQVLIRMF